MVSGGADEPPMKKRAAREGHSLIGLTPLVLLARALHGAEGRFAARSFAPEWEYLQAERPYVPLVVEATTSRWGPHAAFRLRLTSPSDDRQATVAIDPRTGALLGAHVLFPLGPAFDLRCVGAPDDAPDPLLLDAAPTTALGALCLETYYRFLPIDELPAVDPDEKVASPPNGWRPAQPWRR